MKNLDARHRHRCPPITSLPIATRLEAFNRTLEFKRGGDTPVKIFDKLHDLDFPIKYDTILAWISGARNPARKLNLIRKMDGNLVELIGMVLGDGNWAKRVKGNSYHTGRVLYGSKDIELAEKAGALMAIVLGKPKPYRCYWSKDAREYFVPCGSKQLVELLPHVLVKLRNLVWRFRIRFLKGIYNAEGSVTVRVRNGHLYPRVYLSNSNLEIIRVVRRMLKSLGMGTTIELNTPAGKRKQILGKWTTTNYNVYNICIGRREHFKRFANLVGFDIVRKQDSLSHIMISIG
jgi:intein-encoded DNA endonuclease-like protein